MAPKKKGSKAKSADPAKFIDKERIKRAEAEIVSLQRLLEVRNHEVTANAHSSTTTAQPFPGALLLFFARACRIKVSPQKE